ncbi:hypothetical protein FisN_16Hh075 [Fistulifera solaris]|uniref:Pentacotripeptide-repeat region of PRORP domain-containing protein n=1 Tax=Fistulifera solaris TaxID=1519565 RepID=A0A1Z5KTM7_FISSO|nr:hypothetical protein FisN_16Hh075 [Fistulifera solaris]|eukprot:GAX29482.1 hypothetical protein FisN_16Hh075 [Fistulifera solaris]
MRRLGRPLSRLQHWLISSPPAYVRTVTTTVPRTTESLSVKVQSLLTQKDTMTPSQWQLGDKTLQLLSQQPDKGELAEALLERMVSEASPEQPVTVWYRWVMRAWALTTTSTDTTTENQLPYSVFRAHQLLEKMQQRHLLQQHAAPDIAVYDAFLYVCAASRPYSAAVAILAQSLVQRLEQTGDPYPSTLSYNNVLTILLQSPQYGAASHAEDWLLRLSEHSASGLGPAQPNTQSFNRVLHAWKAQAPDRAYAILQFMKQHNSIAPDVVSFATVLHAYRDDPETAEQVFQEALQYFSQTKIDLTQCLDAVLIAWAYSRRDDAVEKVQALLRNAYDVPQLHPTAATHRICLQAFFQNGDVDAATQYLYEMIAAGRPLDSNAPSIVTTDAFHVVLQGWLDSGRPEALEQSQELLQVMMELSHELPCAPEVSTFVRCLQMVWNHKGSPQSALQILEQAEQRQMVNFYTYKWVLQILERSPSYAFVAYDVLQRALSNVKVESTALHRLTMDTLLKNRSLSAMELALQLLLHEFPDQSIRALELSYVSVLQAFARTARAGAVAIEVYQHICQNKPSIRYNATIRNAILQTMVQSEDYQIRACDVLQEMVSDSQGPDRACLDDFLGTLLLRVEASKKKQNVQSALTKRIIQLLELLVEQHRQNIIEDCPSLSIFRRVYDLCNSKEEAQKIKTWARTCYPPERLEEKANR